MNTPSRLPYTFAQQTGLFFEGVGDARFSVKHREDTPITALIEARRLLGPNLQFERLDDEQFADALTTHYQTNTNDAAEQAADASYTSLVASTVANEDLLAQEDDAPIIRLINALLSEAIAQEASDIHVETFERRVQVRFRVDGELRDAVAPHRTLALVLVSRIKVMAKLDIAEKRIPQDGRITVQLGKRSIDVRVSTLPTRHGERVVMRLLDRNANQLALDTLGMMPATLAVLNDALKAPHGIVLVTGPTGSGKTTSLYAGLASLNDGRRNILTVEDPVEYDLDGIGQTQVNEKAGMSFAKGLRAILRQDPDVVMIGEIRDKETADIAVQASLTGHLVLSTLHTNTAIGAIARLRDMGVEPFLLASSITALMAQRLVRTLCTCKTESTITPSLRAAFDLNENIDAAIFTANGCERCHHSGYRGRMGLYELIPVNESLRQLIHQEVAESQLVCEARLLAPSIRQEGWKAITAGKTSPDEVLRVTMAD